MSLPSASRGALCIEVLRRVPIHRQYERGGKSDKHAIGSDEHRSRTS